MANNAYNSNDYASYNTTGSVRVGNIGIGGENISNRPSGKIAAGQGFFAKAKEKPFVSIVIIASGFSSNIFLIIVFL